MPDGFFNFGFWILDFGFVKAKTKAETKDQIYEFNLPTIITRQQKFP